MFVFTVDICSYCILGFNFSQKARKSLKVPSGALYFCAICAICERFLYIVLADAVVWVTWAAQSGGHIHPGGFYEIFEAYGGTDC